MPSVNLAKFSVQRNGLFLVCLPLIVEIILIFTMTNLVSQAEEDATLAMNSAKVIEIGHRLVELSFAAASGCQGYALTRNPLYHDMYDKALNEFPQVLKKFQRSQSSKEQAEAQYKIQQMTQRYLKILSHDITPGGIDQEENSLSAEVLSMLQNRIEDFLAEESEIQESRFEEQHRSRQRLNQFVIFAVACNIIMAVLLSLFFSNNITRRLGVMINNTVRLASGQPLNSPVSGQDEIAQLDRVFHEMAASLARAEQAKREFAAMVTHDLRVPLNAISLFLQALNGGLFGEISDELKTRAQGAEQNLARLMKLTKDLLEFEKLEWGMVDLQMVEFNIGKVIEMSIESVRDYAESRSVRIIFKDPSPPSLVADRDRINQILTNLLSNAIKFSFKNGAVTISTRQYDGGIEVSVADEGRGIPEDVQHEMFEAFKQVHNTDATELDGTGLGLAICKKLIEQHHGTIGVDSQVGKGSVFWFRIPTHLNGGADQERRPRENHD